MSNSTPEQRLVQAIQKTVTDRLFNHPNFGWIMTNSNPVVQREFFEVAWAFIEAMADMVSKSEMYGDWYPFDKQTALVCEIIRDNHLGKSKNEQA